VVFGGKTPDTNMKRKGKCMKKIILIVALLAPVVLAACSRSCETEPIVEQNHKLIVPPNFGARPTK
jgi:hypothetical protein